MKVSKYFFNVLLLFCLIVAEANAQKSKASSSTSPTASGKQWSVEKARQWYAEHDWIVGADYLPSNAINQLEMWQASTFDSAINDRELGFAENIGFNTMRVFLHSVAWKQDKEGFKKRINTFLNIADRHHIQPLFVFFDDCWNKVPKPGMQPAPKPGVHNSGWVQDPGQPLSADSTL